VLHGEKKFHALLEFSIVDDQTIRAVNVTFLQHDYATDVITFPYEEGSRIEAEIFISGDTARRQAFEYRVSVREEVARLVIHGVLHVCGFDDKRKRDKIVMEKRENLYLNRYMQRDRTKQ